MKIRMILPRFYPILDVETAANRGLTAVAAAEQILDAGAKILQFRHKGFFSRQTFDDLETIAALCREAAVPLVVNDRADIAGLIGAWLHLGQEDLTPFDARRVNPLARIGYSTHNEAQLRASAFEPADYVALGPVFGTASKHNPDPVVGLAELRRLRRLTDRPLVAIGGITRANARSVIEAGADSVAVIGDVFPQNGRVGARVKEWLSILL
jgi:thiamine-phosphate pyrophosphorylase